MTLDMGVEVKVGNFMSSASTTDTMLPPWMLVEAGLVEEDMGNNSDDENAPIRVNPNSTAALLPNAFTISGVHHLLSAVSKDAAAALQEFDRFYGQLEEEEKLLGNSGRRETYFASCLVGTPFAGQTKSFRPLQHYSVQAALAECCGLLQSIADPVFNTTEDVSSGSVQCRGC